VFALVNVPISTLENFDFLHSKHLTYLLRSNRFFVENAMLHPNMPNMSGINAMTDSIELMKKFWSGMTNSGINIPGMVMPTLSVEEVNKQITDLKSVEAWLSMNMNMLRSTIQALEVQSATLATLQSMGQTFTAAINPGDGKSPSAAHSADIESSTTEAKRRSREQLKEELKGESIEQEERAPAPASSGAADFSMPLANPTLWWNMMQDQFKQALDSVVPSETPAPKAAPKTASKSASKTPSSATTTRKSATTRKRKTSTRS
jgi:hypothetical protein